MSECPFVSVSHLSSNLNLHPYAGEQQGGPHPTPPGGGQPSSSLGVSQQPFPFPIPGPPHTILGSNFQHKCHPTQVLVCRPPPCHSGIIVAAIPPPGESVGAGQRRAQLCTKDALGFRPFRSRSGDVHGGPGAGAEVRPVRGRLPARHGLPSPPGQGTKGWKDEEAGYPKFHIFVDIAFCRHHFRNNFTYK